LAVVAEGATGCTGELGLDAFGAAPSTSSSSNERSVDSLWLSVSGLLTAVDAAGTGRTNVRSPADISSTECPFKDNTTPPPTVAPTAVATSATRIVRIRVGAGNKTCPFWMEIHAVRHFLTSKAMCGCI
jgi:hypothetical protein